jgi:hypothetical protein
VVFEIAAIVVPCFACSRPSTRSCLVVPRFERDARGVPFFVVDLRCFGGFVRGLGLVLGAMWTSEVGDTISRTTSTPPRRAARGVRSGGAHPRRRCRHQRSIRSRSPPKHEQSCCSLAAMSDVGRTRDVSEGRPNRRE